MNSTLIGRRASRTLLCVTSLLLTVLLIGCAPEADLTKPVAPDSAVEQSPAVSEDVATEGAAEEAPSEPVADDEGDEFTSCSGEKTVTVAKGLNGQELADALMDQWQRDHPDRNWVDEERKAHAFNPPADNTAVVEGDQGKGHAYGNYTERDVLTWAREAEKFVAEGSRIFHNGEALGSTVGVSCDMCHPHASNTHPETYPKFQVQLGRVALLRDMIDWCVEHPVRGEHMDPNGPKMRALEAYIMAQRKGVEMDYGKH